MLGPVKMGSEVKSGDDPREVARAANQTSSKGNGFEAVLTLSTGYSFHCMRSLRSAGSGAAAAFIVRARGLGWGSRYSAERWPDYTHVQQQTTPEEHSRHSCNTPTPTSVVLMLNCQAGGKLSTTVICLFESGLSSIGWLTLANGHFLTRSWFQLGVLAGT